MEAIITATKSPDYPAEVVCCISDNADAGGLETAKANGILAKAFPRSDYSSKAEHETAITEAIAEQEIDLVCLAGYMRLLSASFVKKFDGRLINIHPSLLPKHKGLDTHQRAIDAGDKVHGCTVHYVNAAMDGGETIAQAQVDVLDGDTADTLAARVLVEEHKLYPQVIADLCG